MAVILLTLPQLYKLKNGKMCDLIVDPRCCLSEDFLGDFLNSMQDFEFLSLINE